MKWSTHVWIIALTLATSFAFADSEAGNRPYVSASEWGQFYAKAIPDDYYGLDGTTKIYQVTEGDDLLLHTFDWYSPQIYIDGFVSSIYVVQMGPWQRGHEASKNHHAVAFYKNDKLLKKYSTVDIVNFGATVQRSVSHYTVFSKVHGFRRPYTNQLYFDIETHGGRLLSFDVNDGLLTDKAEQELKAHLHDANTKIQAIKWQWYQTNNSKLDNANEVVITRSMLDETAPGKFPTLPDGYRYIPDTMWNEPTFEQIK